MPINFDDKNFNPSPFDDLNKDNLDEVLKEVEALRKEAETAINNLLTAIMFHKNPHYCKKHKRWPLVFFNVSPKDHSIRHIFNADLTRDNRFMILGFAYDWLVEQNLIHITTLKEDFIARFWNDNFEHIII